MIVKVQGTITTALQKRSGVSQTTGNAWASQEFVITEPNNNIICFDVFGEENIAQFNVGQSIAIDCIVKSREYNGRYYTSLSYLAPKNEAPKQPMQQVQQPVQPQQTFQQPIQQPSYQQTMQAPQTGFAQPNNNADNLPF